jgi:DNA mismatch repair protein MutS2
VNVPWSAATGAAIGADWLLAAIAPAGDFGRRARAAERAFRPGDEVAANEAFACVVTLAREVSAARLAALAAAIAAAPDPSAAFARAAGGGVLDDVDFFEVSRFLDALAELAPLASHPLFATVLPPADMSTLRTELAPGRTPERTFYVSDAFDAALAAARRASAAAQAGYDLARSRLAARVARYAGLERLRDGDFVLMRERVVAPLPPEIRVIREAPTYLLCELALDAPALAALAERDLAAERVAVTEEDVRARLSARIAASAPLLEAACSALGALDVLVARARFAERFACVRPTLVDAASATFEEGRYLPLLAALGESERRYAAISLELEGVGIVTGPNMGGKTAALRTLGFMVACVALGAPVPAVRAAIPLVDDIAWLGLGALPEDDGLLSAFGTEVVELTAFLERRPARALVLIDEFARTTSPREGRALLVALVEALRDRGAFGLAATHFTGIAASAAASHYAVGGVREFSHTIGAPLDLRAALERIAHATDYRLARVDEDALPPADALALAGALGLDAALLSRARAVL